MEISFPMRIMIRSSGCLAGGKGGSQKAPSEMAHGTGPPRLGAAVVLLLVVLLLLLCCGSRGESVSADEQALGVAEELGRLERQQEGSSAALWKQLVDVVVQVRACVCVCVCVSPVCFSR